MQHTQKQQLNLFRRPPTPKEDKIIKLVSERLQVPKEKLLGYSNKPEHSDPRRLCWFLLSKHCKLPQNEIGFIFGTRSRTAVLHGVNFIKGIPKHDPFYLWIEELDKLCHLLK